MTPLLSVNPLSFNNINSLRIDVNFHQFIFAIFQIYE